MHLPLPLLALLAFTTRTLSATLHPPRSPSTLVGAYTDPTCTDIKGVLQTIPATGACMPFDRSIEYGTLGARYIGTQFLANPHKIVFYSDAGCKVAAGPAVAVPIPVEGKPNLSCRLYGEMGPIRAVRAWCDPVYGICGDGIGDVSV